MLLSFCFSLILYFFFLVCIQHSTKRYLTDCILYLERHSGESNPDIFQKWKNFLMPIFSVFIWTISALAALERLLCIFSTCLIGFVQILRGFFSVFLFNRAISHCLKMFCSNAKLIIARDFSSFYFSILWPESNFFYFLFLLFSIPLLSFSLPCSFFCCNFFIFVPFYVFIRGYSIKKNWFALSSQDIKLYYCGLHDLGCKALFRVFECL